MPLTFFSLALVNLRSMKKHKAHVTFLQKQNMKMTIITGKQIDNFKTVEQGLDFTYTAIKIINNYSLKWRRIVVDIDQTMKRRGKYTTQAE